MGGIQCQCKLKEDCFKIKDYKCYKSGKERGGGKLGKLTEDGASTEKDNENNEWKTRSVAVEAPPESASLRPCIRGLTQCPLRGSFPDSPEQARLAQSPAREPLCLGGWVGAGTSIVAATHFCSLSPPTHCKRVGPGARHF